MAKNVHEIKPVRLGPWITPEFQTKQEPNSVKPVGKAGEGVPGSANREPDTQFGEVPPVLGPEQTKELVENVQSYLADLNTSLSFEVHEKTGELVVKVVNRDTQEVIRQIPPDDLLKLHDKLQELRGVLFDGKA